MGNIYSNISDRILYIVKNENINVRKLEVMVGTSQGVLNKIVNNNGDLKCSIASKILELFPHYSAEWFVRGVGEPLRKDNNEHDDNGPVIRILFERINQQKEENAKLNDLIDHWLKQFYPEPYELPKNEILPQAAEETDQEYSRKNK